MVERVPLRNVTKTNLGAAAIAASCWLGSTGAAWAMDTSDIRKDVTIMVDGAPHRVVSFEFVKPGKAQAFTKTVLVNMETGAQIQRSFRSGEMLEPANIEVQQAVFESKEGSDLVFKRTGEPEKALTLPGANVGDAAKWLSPGTPVTVTLYQDKPIGVDIPPYVVLEISNCEEPVDGGPTTKPATLSTGAVIQVPQFVRSGNRVKIDTVAGRYLETVENR